MADDTSNDVGGLPLGATLAPRQRVFLSTDERLVVMDPREARARAEFAPALEASQQSGHSVAAGSRKAWAPRHSAIMTKLPVATPLRSNVAEAGRRLQRAGGRITAVVGPRAAVRSAGGKAASAPTGGGKR